MSRVQKIRWYADQLMKDAVASEQKGDREVAVSKYLQAADLLLLLAKAEENYTTWKSYTDKAAHCQQKTRSLIALAPKSPQ